MMGTVIGVTDAEVNAWFKINGPCKKMEKISTLIMDNVGIRY